MAGDGENITLTVEDASMPRAVDFYRVMIKAQRNPTDLRLERKKLNVRDGKVRIHDLFGSSGAGSENELQIRQLRVSSKIFELSHAFPRRIGMLLSPT